MIGLADVMTTLRNATFGVSLAAMTVTVVAPSGHAFNGWRPSKAVQRTKYPLLVTSGHNQLQTGVPEPEIDIADHDPPTGLLIANVGGNVSHMPVAYRLRAITELPVTALGRIFRVTRQAYHGWLTGAPVSAENAARLEVVADAIERMRSAQPNLKTFLLQPRFGVRPVDLLRDGRYDAAVGLALYPDVQATEDEVAPLDWNEADAGAVAAFRYKSATRFARIDPDTEHEHLDDLLPVGTVVVTG